MGALSRFLRTRLVFRLPKFGSEVRRITFRRAFSPLGMTLCRVLPGSQRGLMAAAAAAEYVAR